MTHDGKNGTVITVIIVPVEWLFWNLLIIELIQKKFRQYIAKNHIISKIILVIKIELNKGLDECM